MSPLYERLTAHLRDLGGAAVAFSGGVDSALLLAAARDALGERTLAVTVTSPAIPRREVAQAEELARDLGVRFVLAPAGALDDPDFRFNSPRRCYVCKKHIFRGILAAAQEAGLPWVLEGSNRDDLGDYRPGMEAVQELGVRSPFLELGIGKAEIRAMARERGLPVWAKPAAACLASRIPYGEEITLQRLARIEAAEEALRGLGLGQLRVRDHGTVARVELAPEAIAGAAAPGTRDTILGALQAAGYAYVALDLAGYRTGAMNETLGPQAPPERPPERDGGDDGLPS